MDNNSFEEKKNDNINNQSHGFESEGQSFVNATEAIPNITPDTSYHMSGEQVPDGTYTYRPQTYGTQNFTAGGESYISYGPNSSVKPPKKKKNGGRVAGAIVLVVCCILFSFGFGLVGSFVGNEFFADEIPTISTGDKEHGQNVSTNDDGKAVVVDRVVDHVESSSDGSELTYTDVEAAVGDSVVAITTEYKSVSLWQEYVTSGAGSGVIMSKDGHIITNFHVVADSSGKSYADVIKVSLKNGNEYEATVIGGDSAADIAVIKVETDEELVSAVFADSDKLKVGEEVIAIGNPLGELSGTTTNGIISALARKVNIEGVDMNLLQTNAAVNPGNSGGGLFNMSGELVGIVNAKSSGTGIEGLGFAIPSNDAYDRAKAIIEAGGNVSSANNVMIGVTFVDITDAYTAYSYGVDTLGVYVYKLEEGFNDKILRAGDRIIAVNGQEISETAQIASIVKNSEEGDILEFVLYRDGKVMTLDVKCYEAKKENNVDF